MFISPQEKLKLENRARQTKDKHEYTRLCIILARSENMSPESIAQAHRISISSVYQYIVDYERENKTQHDIRNGRISKLNTKQAEELIKYLETFTYMCSKQICAYVKEKYEVEYTVSGMTFWLKEHGFVYKEPVPVPGKLNIEKQEAFIKKYEELKAGLPENEKIYFSDAVHPAHQSQAACGWIKKVEVKTLPTTNKQKRVHIAGAISLDDMHVVIKEYGTIDGVNMIDFFEYLESCCNASKIHLICDNGRAYKNKLVEEYLKTSRIEIHYLPAYSPNLNPIERLWKIMRERKTYNRCYKNFEEFAGVIRHFFFEEIPKMKDVLRKRITDVFQRIELNHITLHTV